MQVNRRDFLKSTTAGALAAATGAFWHDALGNALPSSSSFFEARFGITRAGMAKILTLALSKGGDFAELFFEHRIANSISMEEAIIKDSSETRGLGVGIRVLKGDQTGYAYTNDLSFDKMKQAALTAAAIANTATRERIANLNVKQIDHRLYDLDRPLHEQPFGSKVELVKRAYAAAESYDRRVTKVQIRLLDEIQHITIANSRGLLISDIRPQVRLYANATAEENGNRNSGFYSGGGRIGSTYFENVLTPETIGTKAAEEAIILLTAVDPPAGEQPVVLSSDQSGVMIHEAVGHPLEADGNRKKTSIMWDKLGQMVANPIVTIYDDPTIPHYRGTLAIDDEGTVTTNKVLIENGRLVGYLQDSLSAGIMGVAADGHGRRESYQNYPIPRMCNTVLARGQADPQDIIRTVQKGFYAVSYQGGMVQDSGKFTFSVNMGYLIEDGELTRPVKNATLIGTNVQILNQVEMIGNDMGFFLGTCGKEGQSVPVTAGTPTLKIAKMTVGGRS